MGEKIFDDFSFSCVNCNDCESWWLNQCDGVNKGSEKSCTAFKAVRSVVIPEQIKSLRTAVKWLSLSVILLGIAVAMLSISVMFGG